MPYSYGDPSKFTRTAVRKAGQKIIEGKASSQDDEIVRNWRNSHAFLLKTFRQTLRRYISHSDGQVVFAQRLKRLNTIVDKLKTGRAKDLSTMHDLAGCRLIFESVEDLNIFRRLFHLSRAKHKRIHPDKYDYIASPKSTGYRGIHDVYSYEVEETTTGSIYNGLRIEIQYRTKAQHAWATAVEISDLLDGYRIKFESGVNIQRERLFALASEYIARTKENMRGFLPDLTDQQLIEEFQALEGELHIISNLNAARKNYTIIPRQKNIVLHFAVDQLNVAGFARSKQAIMYRDLLEQANPFDDIVYVSGENPAAIANAFRNYFNDAADFVDMVRPALQKN